MSFFPSLNYTLYIYHSLGTFIPATFCFQGCHLLVLSQWAAQTYKIVDAYEVYTIHKLLSIMKSTKVQNPWCLLHILHRVLLSMPMRVRGYWPRLAL